MIINSTKSFEEFNIKAIVFGQSGAGKTTLAASLNKVLIISAESGLLSIAGRDIDYIDLSKDDNGESIIASQRIEKLREVYSYLLTDEAKEKYDNIYIDSISEIGSLLVDSLNAKYPDRKDALVLWGDYNKEITGIIKAFRDLPFYNVIFTALASIDEDEMKRKFIGIQLNGKISSRIPQYFDEVLYLGIHEDGSRYMLTSATDKILAKDRSGKLENIEDANLSLIFNKIKGEKK